MARLKGHVLIVRIVAYRLAIVNAGYARQVALLQLQLALPQPPMFKELATQVCSVAWRLAYVQLHVNRIV